MPLPPVISHLAACLAAAVSERTVRYVLMLPDQLNCTYSNTGTRDKGPVLNFMEFTLTDQNGTNRARLGTPYANSAASATLVETNTNDELGRSTFSTSTTADPTLCTYWRLDLGAANSINLTDIHSLSLHNRWGQLGEPLCRQTLLLPQHACSPC
jgi:hypothetical protein